MSGELKVSPTDYWVIPCHTFEEVRSASAKYTGNLPIMKREEIARKYGIKVPEEATHYETDDTPS